MALPPPPDSIVVPLQPPQQIQPQAVSVPGGSDYVVDFTCPPGTMIPRQRVAAIAPGSVFTYDPAGLGGMNAVFTPQAALIEASAWYGQPANADFIASRCGVAPAPAPPPAPPAAPPPAAPPPAPPPAPVTLPPCKVSVPLVVLPLPGSKEWCQSQQDIINQLSQMGDKIFLWIEDAVTNSRKWAYDNAGTCDNLPFSLSSFFSDLWKLLKCGIASLTKEPLEQLYQYLCAVKAGYIKFKQCNITGVTSILIVRSVVRSFHNFRLGTDAFAWATVDISFDWHGLEIAIDYLLNSLCPYHIPSIPEAIECWVQNQIDFDIFSCWMAMNGADVTVWDAVIATRRDKLTVQEYIQWARRHKVSDEDIAKGLRFFGWLNPDEAKGRVELYDELPTIADHLHWLQRNVFDDEYIKDYDLLNGFEERFWVKFGSDLRSQGMKKEYAALHYAAHWIQPSPGQLIEMLRRLRPGRVDPTVQFTEQDLFRLMAEQDIAPYFRNRLRAIAYEPFGLRFLRQLFDTRQIGDDEAVQRFMDLGYSLPDATILLGSERIRRTRTTITQTRGPTAGKVRQLYLAEELDKNAVITLLTNQGYPNDAIDLALTTWDKEKNLADKKEGEKTAKAAIRKAALSGLQLGTISADNTVAILVKTGIAANHANSIVQGVQSQESIAITKQAIGIVRKSVLNGRTTLAQASEFLASLGLLSDAINRHLQIWALELQAGKRQLSAQQIIKKACDGLISMDEAKQRLLNLNYADADAALMMADITQCIAKNEGRLLEAQQKQGMQQAKAIMQLQQQIASQAKAAVAALEKSASKADLVKMYVTGVIGRNYLITRLMAIGVSEIDANAYASEADIAKAKANAKKKA